MILVTHAAMLSGMIDRDEKAVGKRLRVAMRELGYKTTLTFSAYLGVERGTLDAWLNGRAFPPVRFLMKLRDEHGITLDWIFLNDPSGLSYARGIRLQAALAGMKVPPTEVEEQEVELAELQPSVVARPQRKKKKAATS